MAKKIYVLDTSVCLTDCNVFYNYGINDIVIPLKVLEELDKNKHRQDVPGSNARRVIRFLDNLRKRGTLQKGVRIAKRKGLLSVQGYTKEILPKEFNIRIPDNEIVAVALTTSKTVPHRKVIMVSRDINMRIKCDALGIACEDYEPTQIVKSKDSLYTGFEEVLVDEQIIDKFYNDEPVFLRKEDARLYQNQFVMLISNSNNKKTGLARFVDYKTPLIKVRKRKKDLFGMKPRNKEQDCALNILLDTNVPVVSLIGKAGTGKTLIALAAGLEQILTTENYKRMVVLRPIQTVGKDLGYLPGSKSEKLKPWIAPIEDNLRYMIGDKMKLEEYMDHGIIEIEAIAYIRGRSISDAYIIIDEAQNLSIREVKTLITRVGERTKIILTGDIEQIDNAYVNDITNGLTHVVEKLKEHHVAGHVTLIKGERSEVATIAAKVL